MASRKKVKWDRVILIVLALVGALTIVDNGYRLVKEVGSSVIHAVQNHQWNMAVIK